MFMITPFGRTECPDSHGARNFRAIPGYVSGLPAMSNPYRPPLESNKPSPATESTHSFVTPRSVVVSARLNFGISGFGCFFPVMGTGELVWRVLPGAKVDRYIRHHGSGNCSPCVFVFRRLLWHRMIKTRAPGDVPVMCCMPFCRSLCP